MPSMRARQGRGPLAVVLLGVFSGTASACCAPVLAGVVAVAGVTASIPVALLLGMVYVFGMVAPLFVMSLLWDRFDWGESRLLKGFRFQFRVLGRSLTIKSAAAASGAILVAMGLVVIAIAFNGIAMAVTGWQLVLSGDVQHFAHLITVWLSPVPDWRINLILLACLMGLAWFAFRQVALGRHTSPAPTSAPSKSPEHV